jgi:hypothetical protein
MNRIIRLAVSAGLLSLCGCASLGGNAFYTYTKTKDGCTLRIDSGRELPSGFDVVIGPDCSVSGNAGVATQGRQVFTAADIQRALAIMQVLPSIPPIPAPVTPQEQPK